jgi:branched-chain amino acid transport system permease protein
MDQLAIVGLDGIVFASYLFLVSAGLTFIYGVMRILNTAHGSLYGLGAYLGAWLVLRLWPGGLGAALGPNPLVSLLVLLVAAVVVGVLVGPLLERIIGGSLAALFAFLGLVWSLIFLHADYLPLLSKPVIIVGAATAGLLLGRYLERALPNRSVPRGEVIVLILTFALFLILDDTMKLVWGVDPLLADLPYSMLGSVHLAGITYPLYPFLLTGIAILAAILLSAIINRTRFGKLVIAVIADREVSAALGIDVPRIYQFAFALGAVLAALGGSFIAPMQSVVPGISVEVIILAFAVTTIGGLGSVAGAAIGAVLVGLLRAAAVHYLPELDLFVIYALMGGVLLVRPNGLFGSLETRRI